MASYSTAVTMVDEFMAGATKSRIKRQSLYIDRNGAHGSGLYSYGNHYPVLLETPVGFLVNMTNKSVKTSTQRNGVLYALELLGYKKTGIEDYRLRIESNFCLFTLSQG